MLKKGPHYERSMHLILAMKRASFRTTGNRTSEGVKERVKATFLTSLSRPYLSLHGKNSEEQSRPTNKRTGAYFNMGKGGKEKK